MPKKLRKSRAKYRARGSPKPTTVKEVIQSTVSPKQAPLSKPPLLMAQQSARYQYVLSDMRRALVIAGALLALLIALYFFLG